MAPDWLRPGVALAGMGLAITGIALENSSVVWGAIAVLAVAFLLRFLRRRPAPHPEPEHPRAD